MRVIGFVLAVLLVGGCGEVNNYYGCGVDDGGCGMGRGYDDRPRNHYGDDDLDEGAAPGSGSGSGIFTEDSKTQDSALFTEGVAPQTLVEARTKDGAPHLISVNLATPIGEFAITVGGPPPSPAEAYAIIEFGVGGTAYQMEVDYGVGIQFAVLASRIKISSVFAKIPSDVAIASSGSQLRLAASVGGGTVAPTQAPTRTAGFHWAGGGLGLVPATARYFPVPMFAKSVAVTARQVGVAAPLVILQLNDMYNNISYYAILAAYPSIDVPLSNEIRSIYIYNNGAFPIYDLRLIYKLGV